MYGYETFGQFNPAQSRMMHLHDFLDDSDGFDFEVNKLF